MKTILKVLFLLAAAAPAAFSQNVNWRGMRDDRPNAIQLNLGYDYGVTTQVGYTRSFFFYRPVLVGLDYSLPMGSVLLDDFKVRFGAQVEVFESNGFSATVKIQSNFRRYQNDLVRMLSFGSDFAAVAGYYDPSWFAAAEFGFDKAITTELKHSDVMKRYGYAGVKDGWYVPTAGHFYYGLQGGAGIGDYADLTLRLGMTDAQFHEEDALLPYYAQLGFGVKF